MTPFEKWWHENRHTFTATGTVDEDIAEDAWSAGIKAFAEILRTRAKELAGKTLYHPEYHIPPTIDEIEKELLK